MKIVLLNHFFWPDSSATSQLLTDLADGLATRGHDVHVICSKGGYATAGETAKPAVTIHRVFTTPFGKGRISRMASYLSFLLFGTIKACTLPKYDAVLTMTTPPLVSVAGSLAKALRGCRHYISEQDIYPDIAVRLGVISEGGLIDRVIGAVADWSRRYADGVMVLGSCMKERMVARGVPAENVAITANWSDASSIRPMPRPGDPAKLVLLYSGNLGLAHDLDTLLDGIRALRHDARFQFIFVGAGEKRAFLQSFVDEHGIDSVEQRGYVPRDQLSEGLAIGDIGVVLQKREALGMLVPSKIYGVMASGRPVLFVGPANSAAALTLAEHACGWQIENGDTQGLVALLQRLAQHPEEVREAGWRARVALLQHFDMPIGVDRIARVLEGRQPASAAINHALSPARPGHRLTGDPVRKVA